MKDKIDKIKIGDVFPLNGGGSCTVIEYKNFQKITIVHNDNYAHKDIVEGGNLRKGNVRNPYEKRLFGTGIYGVGPYKARCGKKKTPEYSAWSGIIQRGHSEEFKKENPSYLNVSVHPDWHNFQCFAKWFFQQPHALTPGFQLDKDLIILGNQEYSPFACSFLPSQINSILNDCGSRRGELKQGVSLRKRRNNPYVSRISINGESVILGYFNNENDAYETYKKAKTKYVREMAEIYKSALHPLVYKNLRTWELD